jgi:hypothetical protein
MVDTHVNGAYSRLVNSPGTAGVTFTVITNDGSRFGSTFPMNAVVWPSGQSPHAGNMEIVRITARTNDDLTVTRTQESSTNRNVIEGYQIAVAATAKTFTDIETEYLKLSGGNMTGQIAVQATSPITRPPYAWTIDPSGTNLDTNPSFETNTTGKSAAGGTTLARSNTAAHVYVGDWGLRVTKAASVAVGDGVSVTYSSLTAGQTYVFSVYCKQTSAARSMRIRSVDNATSPVTTDLTFDSGIIYVRQRLIITIGANGNSTTITIGSGTTDASLDFCVDGYQFENTVECTNYYDGSMGQGYAWTGTAHASTSTRTGGMHVNAPLQQPFQIFCTPDGRVGIGYAVEIGGGEAEARTTFDVTGETTAIDGTWYTTHAVGYVNPTANSAGTYSGLDVTVSIKTGNVRNVTGWLTGIAGAAWHGGTGTVTTMYGLRGSIVLGAGAFATTAIAVEALGALQATGGSGTITYSVGFQNLRQQLGITGNYGMIMYSSGIKDGIAGTTDSIGLYVPGEALTLGNTTGTLTNWASIYLARSTVAASAGLRTVTNLAQVILGGSPVPFGNLVGTNGPYTMWQQAGLSRVQGVWHEDAYRQWGANATAGAATISVWGASSAMLTVTSGTAATTAQNANGDWLIFSTTASNGNVASVAGTFTHTQLRWSPQLTWAFETPATITSMRLWIGLFSADPSASDSPAISLIGLRYSTNASDTTFRLCTKDGTTLNNQDSEVTVTASQKYLFLIDCTDNTTVWFYLASWNSSGTVLNAIRLHNPTGTNLPAASTALGAGAYVTTLTNGQRDGRFSSMKLKMIG